jgi:hypothetical protein
VRKLVILYLQFVRTPIIIIIYSKYARLKADSHQIDVLSTFNSVTENLEENGDQEKVAVGGRMSSSNLSTGVGFQDMQIASSFNTVNSQ